MISENKEVYRSEYLAYKIYNTEGLKKLSLLNADDLAALVKKQGGENYAEGYVKGVHDQDAITILTCLVKTEESLGLLKYTPDIRAYAQFFWNSLVSDKKEVLDKQIKASGSVLAVFPDSDQYEFVIEDLVTQITPFLQEWNCELDANAIANYLFKELYGDDEFCMSAKAIELKEQFQGYLKTNNGVQTFEKSIASLNNLKDQVALVSQWLHSFNKDATFYSQEAIVLLLFNGKVNKKINHINAIENISTLKGSHGVIKGNDYSFNYHLFINKLAQYNNKVIQDFIAYKTAK